MAHTTTRALALAAGALTLTALTTQPAGAQVRHHYNNTPEWTVPQDHNWETLSNLPMVDAVAVPPYGWRNGFRVRVGARWDSGTFYGAPWGTVEARATVWQDGPHGPATIHTTPALIAVNAVPLYRTQHGPGYWLPCNAQNGGWHVTEPVAFLSTWACSAPTVNGPGTNYRMGGYTACVHVAGQVWPDIPSSQFDVAVCPRTAQRV